MFCRTCGKEMITLRHLKRFDTYKKTCECPTVRRGSIDNFRKKNIVRANMINSRTRSVAFSSGLPYSVEDIDFIKSHIFIMTYEEIALTLGRARNSIAVKIKRLRESGAINSSLLPS